MSGGGANVKHSLVIDHHQVMVFYFPETEHEHTGLVCGSFFHSCGTPAYERKKCNLLWKWKFSRVPGFIVSRCKRNERACAVFIVILCTTNYDRWKGFIYNRISENTSSIKRINEFRVKGDSIAFILCSNVANFNRYHWKFQNTSSKLDFFIIKS